MLQGIVTMEIFTAWFNSYSFAIGAESCVLRPFEKFHKIPYFSKVSPVIEDDIDSSSGRILCRIERIPLNWICKDNLDGEVEEGDKVAKISTGEQSQYGWITIPRCLARRLSGCPGFSPAWGDLSGQLCPSWHPSHWRRDGKWRRDSALCYGTPPWSLWSPPSHVSPRWPRSLRTHA